MACPIAGTRSDGEDRPSADARDIPAVALRPADTADLAAVNRVIERAVASWALPERVRRLSLPLYRYSAVDLQHLDIWVAERSGETVGVAAWEPADPADAPQGRSALLLHGLYVDPAHHGRGTGRRLLEAAITAARTAGFDGLLVKAQAQAVGFFEGCGLTRLPVANPERDYPHRYWRSLRPSLIADPQHEADLGHAAPGETTGSGRSAGQRPVTVHNVKDSAGATR